MIYQRFEEHMLIYMIELRTFGKFFFGDMNDEGFSHDPLTAK